MVMVNIYIADHPNFPCPIGRTVEEAVNAIRSGYGFLNGFIVRNGEAIFLNDIISADGDYRFINFQSTASAPAPAPAPAPGMLETS